MRPDTRQNAGRFQKGQSGNPAGRPKSVNVQIRQAILDHISQPDRSKEGRGRQRLKVLLDRLYKEDHKTYLAYAFGKPEETHNVTIEEVAGVPGEVVEALRAAFVATVTKN